MTAPILTQQSWGDPTKGSSFSCELESAKGTAPCQVDEITRVFQWIHQKRAVPLLYAALDKFAPLLPINGIEGRPNLWYSPPQSGEANSVGLVFLENEQGSVRLFGSNTVFRITPSGTPLPDALAGRFDACTSQFDTSRLITQVLDAAASSDWIDAIRRVETTSDWFRSMPIYVAVIRGGKAMFYCTNAVLQGKHQSNMALEACCEVTL